MNDDSIVSWDIRFQFDQPIAPSPVSNKLWEKLLPFSLLSEWLQMICLFTKIFEIDACYYSRFFFINYVRYEILKHSDGHNFLRRQTEVERAPHQQCNQTEMITAAQKYDGMDWWRCLLLLPLHGVAFIAYRFCLHFLEDSFIHSFYIFIKYWANKSNQTNGAKIVAHGFDAHNREHGCIKRWKSKYILRRTCKEKLKK